MKNETTKENKEAAQELSPAIQKGEEADTQGIQPVSSGDRYCHRCSSIRAKGRTSQAKTFIEKIIEMAQGRHKL